MSAPPLNGGTQPDLVTSDVAGLRRHKVEDRDTAFDEGRKFRAAYEFELGTNETRVIRFIIGAPIELTLSSQFVDDGGLYYRVFAGGVPGGSFSNDIPVLRANNKPGAPLVASQMQIAWGGTLDVTGVTPTDMVRLRTAGASGQTVTVDGRQASRRGFPATTAYVVLSTLAGSNQAPKGVIKYEWEEL